MNYPTPIRIPLFKPARDVSCGSEFSCVLTEEGRLMISGKVFQAENASMFDSLEFKSFFPSFI